MDSEVREDESRWGGLQEVVAMSWPIVLGSLSFTVLEFCDKLMVAQLGTTPLAAVGSAAIWSFTLSTLILGILGCVSTFVSQCLGRGEKSRCASYAWQGMHLAWLAGVAAVLFYPFSSSLFGLMHHEPEVTRLEVIYFNTRLWGYLPMAWSTAMAAFFQSVRHPRIPMYAAALGAATNIGLNYLLIFGHYGFPQWGIFGAAVGHGRVAVASFCGALRHLSQPPFSHGIRHAPCFARRLPEAYAAYPHRLAQRHEHVS